jgi:hypothetical protein
MEPFDLSDAGVVIGLVGVSIGIYCLYLKSRIEKLDRINAEKEAAMNAGATAPSKAV